MSKYQLTCECKTILPVGIAQAGTSISCPSCGNAIVVPGTKLLRNLPLDQSDAAAANRRQSSSPGLLVRGITALLLALSFWGLGYGGYLAYLRSTAPIEFGHSEDEFYTEIYNRAAEDPPARAWDHWQYLVESGLPKQEPPIYFILVEVYAQQLKWMIGAFAIGSLSLLGFIILSILQSRRGRAV
jgi:hypothetical protein